MRIATVVIMMLFLASCAIFGPPTELDDTKGMSADRIYALASEKLADQDYGKAIDYLKKLDLLEYQALNIQVSKRLAGDYYTLRTSIDYVRNCLNRGVYPYQLSDGIDPDL